MTQRQTLEEAIRDALLHHADTARLPITDAHVRAQAAVAVRAAQTWSATTTAQPMPPFPPLTVRAYGTKPTPPDSDPAPDRPTPKNARCCRPDCQEPHAAVGWRWYLADSWQPVCARHMTGAPLAGRRYNTDYPAAVTQ